VIHTHETPQLTEAQDPIMPGATKDSFITRWLETISPEQPLGLQTILANIDAQAHWHAIICSSPPAYMDTPTKRYELAQHIYHAAADKSRQRFTDAILTTPKVDADITTC